MSAAAEEIARDDQSGEALAERWGVEYLKASAVSVDPRALTLLERGDCKRLRAIPLAAGSSGALVAVSAPSEERFASIREVTGEQTRFVLISEGTLDALLGSRMFADASAKSSAPAEAPPKQEAAPEPAADQAEEAVDPGVGPAAAARRKGRGNDESEPAGAEAPAKAEKPAEPDEPAAAPDEPAKAEEPAVVEDEAPPTPSATEPAPASEAAVESIVGAVLDALKHRAESTPDLPAADASAEQLPKSTTELLAHLDATIETWSAVRTALANVHAEFEETKRALRETKEQLSVAHADNDQHRKRVRTLEGELAESRTLVTQARSRLQEAADLLEADATQLEEPAELL